MQAEEENFDYYFSFSEQESFSADNRSTCSTGECANTDEENQPLVKKRKNSPKK